MTARVFIDGTLTTPRLDHPEGIAVHPDRSVWCGGEAGQIYRIAPDPTAHLLCHPTNIAFRGTTLFAANLGRWHITAIEVV